MWQGDWKGICFNDLQHLLCEKHKQFKSEYEKCEFSNIPDQIILRFATYIRIHVMDPFLFGKPYSQELFTTWAKEGGLLPDEGVFQDGTVNAKSKDIIILVDSVVTHSIGLLLQICLYCKESGENTDECKYAELLHCPHLEDAIKCISSHKTYALIRKCFKKYDEKMVSTSFLVAFMCRFDATQCSTPEETLCKLDKELSDTEGDMWRNTGNDEYKNRNFYQAVAAYTMALKTSRYSTLLYSNRAQAYIKLGKYDEAELDGRRTVVLKPTWCKGYYKLGAALQSQERIHDAHIVADYGMKYCDNPETCKEFFDLQCHKVKWEKECYEKYGCFGLSKNSPKSRKVKPTASMKEYNNELNDVPELTDPSNSEESDSEIDQNEMETKNLNKDEKNIATLYSSVDSNETDPENNHKNVETKSKTTPSVNEKNSTEEKQIKKEHFKKLLTQGSSAIFDGCGHAAVRYFQQALLEYKASPQLFNLEDYDLVCLKYAFGSACIKSGTFEDLNKALNIFNEIIKEHKETRFPIAYYGLGLSYYKLNRFKEALLHLTTVFSIIEKGIHCTVYSWPGTVTAIEETKSGILKSSLEALISKCQCPPPPDAVCRYKECYLTPSIYYTDPDFKGFSYIQCQDRCCLQYHPSCWRALKDTLDRTDKDFLDQQCLTPDCECIILHVESIGKDGTTEKCFDSDTNDKFKKHKQKKSKLEKKLEIRELRKKKRQESQSAHSSISETQDILEEEELEETKENVLISESNLEDQLISNEVKELNEHSNKVHIKEILSNLSVDAKPFYGWKKDGNSLEFKASEPKTVKQKERKKPKRPTLSLEEFCDGSYDFSLYSQYQKRLHRLQEDRRAVEEEGTHWSTFCENQMSRIPQLDPSRPFHIPEVLREDPSALEAVLQSYDEVGETKKNKAIKENIYSYMEGLLTFKGPLHLEDPELLQEIASFPTEAQKLISESGGFKDFMLKSMRFAVVGEQICIISDVVTAYALPSKQKYDAHSMNKLDDFDHFYGDDDDDKWENEDTCSETNNLQSPLNPHAEEYSPNKLVDVKDANSDKTLKNPLIKSHSKDFNSSDDSFQNKISAEEKASNFLKKDANSKEPLISLLAKLRQPLLSFNEECNSVNSTDDNDSSTTDENQNSFVSIENNDKTIPIIEHCSKVEEHNNSSCNRNLVEHEKFSNYNIILGCENDSNLKTNAVSKDSTKICTYDSSSDKLKKISNSEVNFVSEKSKESSNSCLVSQLPKDKKCELLLQVLKLVTTGDDATEIITHINNQLKPFSLILTAKKQSRCIQVGAAETDLISKGVMKEDDELHKAAETISMLEEEKLSLEEQKKYLESKLESALDLITRLQNKLSVETAALQKKIEDANLQFEEEKLEFKKKQSGWESDQKRWQQLQTKINEELKNYKQEIENIRDQLQKTEALLEEVHKSQKSAEAELENERKAKNDIEMTLKNFLEDYKEKTAKLKKRAQNAELELLNLKKAETLQKIDNSIVSAEQKFNELQDGINKFGNNLPHMYKKLLTSFLLQLKEYVNQLTTIRCNVLIFINQYVTEVDKGKPLSKLPPLIIPPLPDFPSLTPLSLAPLSLLTTNPDQSIAAPQSLYTNSAQLHNFNGQLLSPNITHVHNIDSTQHSNQPSAQFSNANAIFSNFNSTHVSSLNSSHLNALTPQLNLNPINTTFASAPVPASVFPFSVPDKNINKYSVASKASSGPPGLETLHTSVNTSSSFELPIPCVLPVTSSISSKENVPVVSVTELSSSIGTSSLKTQDISEQNILSSGIAQSSTEHLYPQEFSKIDAGLSISSSQCEDAGLTTNIKCAMIEAKSLSNISSSSSLSSLHSVEYSKLQESKEIVNPKDIETVFQTLQNNSELVKAMGARPKISAVNQIDDLELESSVAIQNENLELRQKYSGPSRNSVCDSSNSEAMSIELGYTLKSEEPSSELNESVSNNKDTPFINVQHSQQSKPQNREKKNCYEKLLLKLQSRYPHYSQSELMYYIKDFRKQQNNKLSGLTLESIVNGVSSIISQSKQESSAVPSLPRPRSRPTVLVNKSTVPPVSSKIIPPVKPATTGECPWAKTPISLPQWTGSGADKNCIICLEDMTSWNIYRTDCGHRFHSNCIRAWLNKNSTCPICRVYILLPDEFPALG